MNQESPLKFGSGAKKDRFSDPAKKFTYHEKISYQGYSNPQQEKDKQKKIKLKVPIFKNHDMKNSFISVDQAFEYIGDNSRFQKRVITLFSLSWVFYSFFVMGMPLMFETPNFECDLTGSGNFIMCSEDFACTLRRAGFENRYKTVSGNLSLAGEFDLICENKSVLGSIGAIFFIGSGLAGLVWARVADKIGRKKTLVITITIGSLAIVLAGFAQNLIQFQILFFFAGFGFSGYEITTYVYASEISGMRFRNFSSNILFVMWGIGQILVIQIFSVVLDWRIRLYLVIGAPLFIIVIFVYQFLVESPRYLISEGRYNEARNVFKYISVYNLRPPFEYNLIQEMERFNGIMTRARSRYQIINLDNQLYKQEIEVKHVKNNQSYQKKYFDIFTHSKSRNTTFHMWYAWFMRFFVYYVITFSLEDLGTNVSTNFMFLALSEICAALISAPLKLKMKRLSSFRFCMIIMASLPLLLLFVKIPDSCFFADIKQYFRDGEYEYEHDEHSLQLCWQEIFTVFVAICLKFSITFYLVILMTYTSEVYPTQIRSQGYGLCISFGQLFGSTLAPLYLFQNHNLSYSPLTILGILGVLGFLQTFRLEETQQQEMEDNIEFDAKKSYIQEISTRLIEKIDRTPNRRFSKPLNVIKEREIELETFSHQVDKQDNEK